PLSLLDSIGADLLRNLLNGFSFALNSGITAIYPTSEKPGFEDLDQTSAANNAHPLSYPVCAYWRGSDGCSRDISCAEADKYETLRYLTGTWSGPRLYCCRSLGLLEMAYPLLIQKKVVGVLFSGQIILDDSETDWLGGMKQFGEMVDWESVPKSGTHRDKVR